MAIPVYVNKGTSVHTTVGTLTPPMPSGWAEGDILLIVHANRFNASPAAPSGWALLASTPSVNSSRNAVYWRRAVTGDTSPTLDAAGNASCTMVAYRGCIETGNPYEAAVTGSDGSADTSVSTTGLTTLGDDRLVLSAGGRSGDTTTGQSYSGWAASGLSDITEQVDQGYTDGSGGGYYLVEGGKASAGACGPFTATKTVTEVDHWVDFALKPGAVPYTTFQAVFVG